VARQEIISAQHVFVVRLFGAWVVVCRHAVPATESEVYCAIMVHLSTYFRRYLHRLDDGLHARGKRNRAVVEGENSGCNRPSGFARVLPWHED